MSLNIDIISGRDPVNGEPREVDPKGTFSELLMDVVRIIFQDLKTNLPTLALVCRNWKAIADDEVFREMIRPVQAFGTKEWQKYIGVDAAAELLLPRCAYSDLEIEDGFLTFIPDKVRVTKEDGVVKEVLLDNLEAIGNLVKNPTTDLKTGYSEFCWIAPLKEKRQVEKPHWVWIKKEVVAINKLNFEALKLINASKGSVSGVIDTVISVFMEYVRSGNCNFVYEPIGIHEGYVRVNEPTEGSPLCLRFTPIGLSVETYHYAAHYGCVAVAFAQKSFVL